MSTLKIEHISHLDNGTPDLSIDSSGHLNIVNGNLQMGGVTMLNTRVRQPVYSTALEQWKHYEPWLEPLKTALESLYSDKSAQATHHV